MKTRLQFVTCLVGACAPAVGLAQTAAGAAANAPTAADTASAPAPEAEEFPINGSVSLRYRFNHANFVETESDDANFGYQVGALSVRAGYDFTDSIGVSVAISVDKELSDSFDRSAGGSTRVQHETEVRDASFGVAWSNFYTIPGVDIGISADLGGSIPTSKASRAAGVQFALSPGLSFDWSHGDFSVGLGLSYTRYFNEDPTQRIDCETFPDQCLKNGGEDLGVPLGLHEVGGSLSLSYKIFEKLSASIGYSLSNSYSAVEFPDDEFTSDLAQTGMQAGTGFHAGSLSLSYKALEKTTVGLGMSTGRTFYSRDGGHVTMPFFDLDSDLHHRTSYSVSISQSL